MTKRYNHLGLMGPFGFGNLGDAAIQQAMLQNIRKYFPKAHVLGFSLNPEDTEKRHSIKSFPIGRMAKQGWLKPSDNAPYLLKLNTFRNQISKSQYRLVRLAGKLFLSFPLEFMSIADAAKKMRTLDCFIISGGGQLDDYWGGPFYHPYTLLVWSLLAKLTRTRLLIISVGAGPVDHFLSGWFIRGALSLADYRSYRDQYSKDFINKVGFKRNDPVYPDLAFSLEIEPYLERASNFVSERSFPLVGVSPMPYFDPRVWPERNQQVYNNYLSKLADFVVWLVETEHNVLLFPSEAVNDKIVINDLRELLSQKGISRTDPRIFEPFVETVDDLLEQLAMTDAIVASRFHGVLLGQLLNKPVLALSYHKKIDTLMNNTGQTKYCMPIDSFKVAELTKRFLDLKNNSETIKSTLLQKICEFQKALTKQYQYLWE